MSLLSLPAELIIQIIQETLPLGYESLMLSCKTVHELGTKFLPLHNTLRARFKHFHYNDHIDCPMDLLAHISKNSLIASYIQTADFSLFRRRPIAMQRDMEQWDISDPDSTGRRMWEMLILSRLPEYVNIVPRTLVEMFASAGVQGMESTFASIVILALLPNLEEVVLPPQDLPPPFGDTPDEERVAMWRLWDAVVQPSKNPNANCSLTRPLSRLTKIRANENIHDMPPLPLSTLSSFLILPSVREVSVAHSLANREHHSRKPFIWRHPAYPYSSVESIELVRSSVEGTELAKLLCHTPKLRVFRLGYATKWHGCGMDWDANAVFESLSTYSSTSLTQLSITIDFLLGSIKGGLRSLKRFTNLKHLELDVRVFFGPPIDTETLRTMSPADYRNHTYEVAHWNGLSVPNLAEILPSSIRTVRLLAGSCREDVLILKGLFAKLDLYATASLPCLESIVVARATRQLGSHQVSERQSDTAWESVGSLVRGMGYTFEEMDVVEA